uniref:Uncharacterized protein n=1 Tax=Solanum tuberosum TaxID=4113 RepID=M1DGP9_SOLTU
MMMLKDNILSFNKLEAKRSGRRTAEEVGDPDSDRRWTQDNFKVESVKLSEPRKLLAIRRPGRRSRSCPPFGPQIKWKSCKTRRAFGEKPEVAEVTRRPPESLFDRLLSAPLNPFCTVTFGGLTLARQKLSAIRQ